MSTVDVLAAHLAARGHGVVAESIWTYATPTDTQYPAVAVAPYNGNVIETFGAAEQQPYCQVFITGESGKLTEAGDLANAVWDSLANHSMDLTYGGQHISTVRCVSVVQYLGLTVGDKAMFSINVEATP